MSELVRRILNKIFIFKNSVFKPILDFLKEKKRIKNNSLYYLEYELSNSEEFYSVNAFDYYKCIFIHIPKAAGISIANALFKTYGAGHKKVVEYKNIFPLKTYNKYYKFTIVRNPYTRLFSAYNFLKKGGINSFDKAFNEKVLVNYNSFDDFVLNYLTPETIYSYIHLLPQFEFLVDENDEINIDFVGRYENLENDFKTIKKKLNLNIQLPHLNNFKSSSNQPISTEVKNKIYYLYRKDFELLNYNK